jgi:hypothetical protein
VLKHSGFKQALTLIEALVFTDMWVSRACVESDSSLVRTYRMES